MAPKKTTTKENGKRKVEPHPSPKEIIEEQMVQKMVEKIKATLNMPPETCKGRRKEDFTDEDDSDGGNSIQFGTLGHSMSINSLGLLPISFKTPSQQPMSMEGDVEDFEASGSTFLDDVAMTKV